MPRGRPKGAISRQPISGRFWSKVAKTENVDDCWIWKGWLATSYGIRKDINGTNYGLFTYNGKIEKAHRVAWILTNGELVGLEQVLHKCDNRQCVNPTHLFKGNRFDNMSDAASKGRLNRAQIRLNSPRSRHRNKV